ncbi:N-acetyl-D-glucosamine kinase-like isoform X1 [Vigna umbellata]|uniref:N-acetyl-D-glucosamine kinase-like isoform X1 n=1 Tax=Vigna umbellata TaxID=87088 RepID=UPI001F5F02A1|nr:N-acetyl-D-glucosamine kinase-like isoform X1 [Vigna umbellata]XP_047181760.1 N-acetyl-D-glucosamine kinase-like isoform X1 [Vigna umbellata]
MMTPEKEKEKEKEQDQVVVDAGMKRYRNGEIWEFEDDLGVSDGDNGVLLGLDGGTTSTVCICMPMIPFSHSQLHSLPTLARAVAGCSNHNSVGEIAARETIEQVMADALSKCGAKRSSVRAVCLAVSGVNHPTDQQRILNWLRDIFPSHVRLHVLNDAVAALSSGTMGKLHGCVLISGTGSIAYGFTEDGKEARAAGAGPVLGDWGSAYGIAAKALTAVVRAYDGRGPSTMLASSILQKLGLSSAEEIIGWTYADPSWARIAALVPNVVICAEAGDEVANNILLESVQELASSVKAVVNRLGLSGQDGKSGFPLVMVGGVLTAHRGSWDIGKEVINCITKQFPGVIPIRPKVEPAVGAAWLAWNFFMKECHHKAEN